MSQATFGQLIDLAGAALGGEALLASDDFFASKDNLVAAGRGVFDPERYTERGKWMDGWESRRRRVPGHDWCIIRLGAPGTIRAVDIDTNHFLGNHPPFASLDGCNEPDASTEWLRDHAAWRELLPEVPLRAGSQNLFAVDPVACTHVRLHILPDGGVARLRVWGEPSLPDSDSLDLAGAQHGALALACSDMFFSDMQNLLKPSASTHMADGWETRRRRDTGHDWIIIRLATPGNVERLEIDTSHFNGNYPDRVSVDAIAWPGAPPSQLVTSDAWRPVLNETRLGPNVVHEFVGFDGSVATHLRLNVFPCGGVARLRAWGRAHPLDGGDLLGDAAAADLARCCGASGWVEGMLARRPFVTREQLLGAAEAVWWRLSDNDWREAFGHHPPIGGDVEQLRQKFGATAELCEGEQAGVAGATDEVLDELAGLNTLYLERFGYIFIVCASGKGADEMLALLKARIDNDAEREIRIAAGEQAKITRLRLTRQVADKLS